MNKFLLVLLMLASASAFAGLNKWVDADGKVHYSDQPPPPNVKAQTLRTAKPEAAAPASAPAAPKTVAEREAELRRAQQEKLEAGEKTAQEQARLEEQKANCETARRNLRSLQQGLRMMEVNEQGERVFVEDEQRQQRIEKAQQYINDHCN
jgi:hypothetical protein